MNKIKDIKKEGVFTNFAQLISNELILRFADLESDWSDKINIGLFLNPASLKLLDNEVKTDVMRNLQLQMEIQEEPPLNLETDICFDSDDKSSDCLELNSFSVPDIFDQQESRKVKVCTDVKEATSILKQYVKIGIETNFDLISFWKLYSNKFPLLYNKFREISSITISNGSIERLFAFSSDLCDWRRNRMSIKRMKSIISFRELNKFTI